MSLSPREIRPIPDPEDPAGPGSQLREARHRANLSLEGVATQLRLDRRTVRALEESDFEHLPAPTFVRGYIRSYARLLGLPPGPILEAFDNQGITTPAILADITQRPQARSSDFPVRLVSYAVIAGLVFMVVMWWHSRESLPGPPPAGDLVAEAPPGGAPAPRTEASAAEAEAPATASVSASPPAAGPDSSSSGPPSPLAARTAPETAATPAQDARAPTAPRPDAAVSPAAGAPQSAPAPETSAAAPLSAQPGAPRRETAGDPLAGLYSGRAGDAPAPAASRPAPSADPAAPETTRAPAEPIPSDVAGGRLNLEFAEDSWVEVYDESGIRHVYRLARAGDTVNVYGTPPFKILLGYARAATVLFDGEAVDIDAYIRGNTARFAVGPEGLGRFPVPPSPEPEEAAPARAEAPDERVSP